MFDIAVYKSIKDAKNSQDVLEYFVSSLLLTNRRWSFYVDWEKVGRLVNHYKVELGILEAIVDASDDEFIDVLKKYPEVVKVFPRLIAVRDDKFSVLEDSKTRRSSNYDFRALPKSDSEIKKYSLFWKNSGLKDALREVKNLRDYLFGVEVGSDTNARKNRGGTEWEDFIEPIISIIAKRNGYKFVVRKKFEKIMKGLGYKVPRDLQRNFDFLVYKGNQFVDIEANFFSGSGTKLEVPGAYVNRKFSEGFSLSVFLFTDGLGWKSAKHRMADFFDSFPCIVNFKMARDGVLEDGLKHYLD